MESQKQRPGALQAPGTTQGETMKSLALAIGGTLILWAIPVLAQSQANGTEPESPGTVLCFQVEAVFVRVQDQADELKDDYDRICATPPPTGETCFATLRQRHGEDLNRLYRYRRWGNALRQEYGNMCGGALNETMTTIVETLEYVSAN